MDSHLLNSLLAPTAPLVAMAIALRRLPRNESAPTALLALSFMGMGISNVVEANSADQTITNGLVTVFSLALNLFLFASGILALTGLRYPKIDARAYIALMSLVASGIATLHNFPEYLNVVQQLDGVTSAYAIAVATMGFVMASLRRVGPRSTQGMMVAIGSIYAALNLSYYALGEAGKVVLHVALVMYSFVLTLDNERDDLVFAAVFPRNTR